MATLPIMRARWRLILVLTVALALVYQVARFERFESAYDEFVDNGPKKVALVPQTLARHHWKATDIVDPACSYLPELVKDLDFPLHMAHNDIKKPGIRSRPLAWIFDSGVKLKTEYLSPSQINRFWRSPNSNLWEVTDEPLMMKAIKSLYHRCEAGEECVFIDGGAAYGYYSQLIRLHFPLVQVLAFNPHPIFAKQMIDNLALAQVTGVCLQQKGLSDKPGTSLMSYGTAHHLGDSPNGVEVQATTLDDYYDSFGKDKLVVLIKLDIEGDAGRAIRGGSKMIAAAENVIMGLHSKDERKECQNLAKLGFHPHTPKHVGLTPNGLCFASKNPVLVPEESAQK